jgi:chemotaxis protein histidine kinase CheA
MKPESEWGAFYKVQAFQDYLEFMRNDSCLSQELKETHPSLFQDENDASQETKKEEHPFISENSQEKFTNPLKRSFEEAEQKEKPNNPLKRSFEEQKEKAQTEQPFISNDSQEKEKLNNPLKRSFEQPKGLDGRPEAGEAKKEQQQQQPLRKKKKSSVQVYVSEENIQALVPLGLCTLVSAIGINPIARDRLQKWSKRQRTFAFCQNHQVTNIKLLSRDFRQRINNLDGLSMHENRIRFGRAYRKEKHIPYDKGILFENYGILSEDGLVKLLPRLLELVK